MILFFIQKKSEGVKGLQTSAIHDYLWTLIISRVIWNKIVYMYFFFQKTGNTETGCTLIMPPRTTIRCGENWFSHLAQVCSKWLYTGPAVTQHVKSTQCKKLFNLWTAKHLAQASCIELTLYLGRHIIVISDNWKLIMN